MQRLERELQMRSCRMRSPSEVIGGDRGSHLGGDDETAEVVECGEALLPGVRVELAGMRARMSCSAETSASSGSCSAMRLSSVSSPSLPGNEPTPTGKTTIKSLE